MDGRMLVLDPHSSRSFIALFGLVLGSAACGEELGTQHDAAAIDEQAEEQIGVDDELAVRPGADDGEPTRSPVDDDPTASTELAAPRSPTAAPTDLCGGLAPQYVTAGVEFFGTAGDECIIGTNGVDRIHGGGGNDVIVGQGGNDTIYG